MRELGPPNPVVSFPWVHYSLAAETASPTAFGYMSATTHVKRAKIPRTRPNLPSSTTFSCWVPACALLWTKEDFDGFNNKNFFAPKIVKRAKIPRTRPNLPSSTTLPCWRPACGSPAGSRFFDGFNNRSVLCQKFKHVRGMLRSAAPKNVAKCRQKMKLVCPGTTTAFAQIL